MLELETCKGGLDLARKDGWSPVKAKVNTLLQYEAAPWFEGLGKGRVLRGPKGADLLIVLAIFFCLVTIESEWNFWLSIASDLSMRLC